MLQFDGYNQDTIWLDLLLLSGRMTWICEIALGPCVFVVESAPVLPKIHRHTSEIGICNLPLRVQAWQASLNSADQELSLNRMNRSYPWTGWTSSRYTTQVIRQFVLTVADSFRYPQLNLNVRPRRRTSSSLISPYYLFHCSFPLLPFLRSWRSKAHQPKGIVLKYPGQKLAWFLIL